MQYLIQKNAFDETINSLKSTNDEMKQEKDKVEQENDLLKNAVQESYKLRQQVQQMDAEVAACRAVGSANRWRSICEIVGIMVETLVWLMSCVFL